MHLGKQLIRVRKYAKFGVFYAEIFLMTPKRLRRESLRLQKFSVTNSFVLTFFATNTIYVNYKHCKP